MAKLVAFLDAFLSEISRESLSQYRGKMAGSIPILPKNSVPTHPTKEVIYARGGADTDTFAFWVGLGMASAST